MPDGGIMTGGTIVLIVLLIFVAFLLSKGFRIVQQSREVVVERLGKFHTVLKPGPHILIPILDNVVKEFDMREIVQEQEPSSVITRDNATVRINAVTYFRIMNVQAAAYRVANFTMAMDQLIVTTLRNLIGELELDEVLNGRNVINAKLQGVLDESTHEWGLKVSRVEIKEITPLGDVAEAMDKQMVAERTRRAQILQAEGSKSSAILQAEGQKQAAILKAEAEREVVLIRTKAEADALKVTADAQRTAIQEVLSVLGPKAIESYLTLKYIEALPKVADGRGATVFLPGMGGPGGDMMGGGGGGNPISTAVAQAAVAGAAMRAGMMPPQAQQQHPAPAPAPGQGPQRLA